MLLCLSSGATKRYKEDILRAAAMPKGALLRFRYDLRYLPDQVKDKLHNKKLGGMQACIAYVDTSTVNSTPSIVPVRKATVKASKVIGQFCVIDFELDVFQIAKDAKAFSTEVRSKGTNLPDWENGKLTGKFCCEIDGELGNVLTSDSQSDWQWLVSSLKSFEDFKDVPYFYYVDELFSNSNGTAIFSNDGTYAIQPDSTYEIRVAQFIPRDTTEDTSKPKPLWLLVAEADAEAISFATGKQLRVDSSYDEKVFRFRCSPNTVVGDTVINIGMFEFKPEPHTSTEGLCDFDIPLHILPKKGTPIRDGLMIGCLLGAQASVPVWMNPAIIEKITTTIICVTLGIFAGLVASFKLKKP